MTHTPGPFSLPTSLLSPLEYHPVGSGYRGSLYRGWRPLWWTARVLRRSLRAAQSRGVLPPGRLAVVADESLDIGTPSLTVILDGPVSDAHLRAVSSLMLLHWRSVPAKPIKSVGEFAASILANSSLYPFWGEDPELKVTAFVAFAPFILVRG